MHSERHLWQDNAKEKKLKNKEEKIEAKNITFLKSLIESILFLSNEPLNIKKLKDITQVSEKEIHKALFSLKLDYFKSDRGVMLKKTKEGYKLFSKDELSEYLEKYFEIKKNVRLSQGTLETLAIIAYKQPITKAEIENLKGTDVSYHLSKLLEFELIEVKGFKELPGRPKLYSTTEKFLKLFRLNSLEDLPPLEKLKDILENEDKIE